MNNKIQRYIPRKLESDITDSLNTFPVTALLGPRQCGKSTLALHLVKTRGDYFFLDLEKPSDLRKLDDPEFFFKSHSEKLICIDEVQRKPELFPVIRVMVDEDKRPGKFLILGSASPHLLKQSSESLAGRIHFTELTPFTYQELESDNSETFSVPNIIWSRGGYPDSVLAPSEKVSLTWRMDFIRTFLERDIPQLGFSIPAINIRRFWTMVAHYHGQLLNSSKFGQALDVTHPTIRRYLEILEKTYMVRILQPYASNVKKRLIKSPKVYVRDTGILNALLEIKDFEALFGHPVFGSSWEGFCIEQILTLMKQWRASFFRTSSGEEIDLILEYGRIRLAFEFKASMAPTVSRGFPGSIDLLKPDKTWIISPVPESYPHSTGAVVTNLKGVLEDLREFLD